MKTIIVAVLVATLLVAGCVQETEEDEYEYDPNDEVNRLTGECYETVADNTGHTHSWCGGAYNTEDYRSPEGVYHSHPIDEPNNLAKSSQGHTHKLR